MYLPRHRSCCTVATAVVYTSTKYLSSGGGGAAAFILFATPSCKVIENSNKTSRDRLLGIIVGLNTICSF